MFLICFLLLLTARICPQAGGEDDRQISLNYKEQPLRSVLEEIRKKTGIDFIFQDRLVDSKLITFHTENIQADEAIREILRQQKLSCKMMRKDFCVLYSDRPRENKEYVKVELKQYDPVKDTSEFISEPKIISSTIMKYPPMAVKEKLEGKVTLKVFVSKDGRVPKVIVEKSSGSRMLDSSAVEYSNTLKFIPAKVNGIPINIWISVMFNFLNDSKQ